MRANDESDQEADANATGIIASIVRRQIEEECSLTGVEWFFLNIVHHEHNKGKVDYKTITRKYTLREALTYKESLDALRKMSDAQRKDEELNSARENRLRGGR